MYVLYIDIFSLRVCINYEQIYDKRTSFENIETTFLNL